MASEIKLSEGETVRLIAEYQKRKIELCSLRLTALYEGLPIMVNLSSPFGVGIATTITESPNELYVVVGYPEE